MREEKGVERGVESRQLFLKLGAKSLGPFEVAGFAHVFQRLGKRQRSRVAEVGQAAL